MIYPECPECGQAAAGKWNGVICMGCGHDVSEYDERVLPGSEARKEWREKQNGPSDTDTDGDRDD